MSSLSSVEAELPPGFRFHPRDEELICDYLMKRSTGVCAQTPPLLIEVDLNKCEPWEIPEIACVGRKEWYFYSRRDKKYATGLRTNRATASGYWKATGKDRPVIRKGNLIGMRKTLVFYHGRAPKGRKTDWVMHEFRLEGPHGPGPKAVSLVKEDWVLCRVFFKSRSEIIPGKTEERENSYEVNPSSPMLSLPALMEPLITFDQTQQGQYNEQVPCFSIFNTNQTSPTATFSLLTHMEPPEILPSIKNITPNFGASNYYNSPPPLMKAVLNHLTKMESGSSSIKDGSPSFGEGSSDSYLSEVGLSSMWNHYI